MSSISGRVTRAARALALKGNPEADALRLANDLVQFHVEADLVNDWVGEPRLHNSRLALFQIADIWKKCAAEMGVPNDGTAERRIVGIYRRRQHASDSIALNEGPSLLERLRSPCIYGR